MLCRWLIQSFRKLHHVRHYHRQINSRVISDRQNSLNYIIRLQHYSKFLNKPTGLKKSLLKHKNDNLNKAIERYDSIIFTLVQTNQDILRKHLDQTENQSYKDEIDSISILNSIVDDDYDVHTLISQLYKKQNLHYQEVKKARMKIERYKIPISDYQSFLTHLYPNSGRTNFFNTFQAYQNLPVPRPLYILPQHLEDFVSAMMYNSQNHSLKMFQQIIYDLESAGMPISVREYNHLLNSTMKSYFNNKNNSTSDNDMQITQMYRILDNMSRVSNEQVLTSTANILLNFGKKAAINEFVELGISRFQAGSQIPDRLTALISMLRETDPQRVKEIYRDMYNGGFLIDISVLNIMIRALINCGDGESAENAYNSLINNHQTQKSAKLTHSSMSMFPIQPQLTKRILLIDTITQILRRNNVIPSSKTLKVPIDLDENSFSTILSYYVIEKGDFTKSFQVINEHMPRCGYIPGFSEYSTIYAGFLKYSINWEQSNLKKLTQKLAQQYIDTSEFYDNPSDITNNLFCVELLQKVFEAYRQVHRNEIEFVEAIQNKTLGNASSTIVDNGVLPDKVISPQTVHKAISSLLKI